LRQFCVKITVYNGEIFFFRKTRFGNRRQRRFGFSRGNGRVINIASCTGRVPVPTVGVYGGSKTALAVMANTRRLEFEKLPDPFNIKGAQFAKNCTPLLLNFFSR
jgi:hypothetical protein